MEAKCSVCDVVLNTQEIESITVMDMMVVCKNHRQFANCVQPDVAKMKLGLITEYPDHLKKCAICDISLTTDEINAISENTYNAVCSKHKIAENWFNKDLSKQWFEFADTQPQPCEYNDENRAKFLEYRNIN